MKMLVHISWRNIWRSPLRSLVIMVAVALGVATLSFTISMIQGFVTSFVNNSIYSEYSHLQIHHPTYEADKEVSFVIPEGLALAKALGKQPNTSAVAARTLVQGMINSPTGAFGATIYGIDPEKEAGLIRLDQALDTGTYFGGKSRIPDVLISTKMADRLDVESGEKIVLTFLNSENQIVSGAFRISGLFNSKSPRMNETGVFIPRNELQSLLQMPEAVHEIALLATDLDNVQPLADSLSRAHPELLVETWQELAPEVALIQSQVGINLGIILGIIMLALAFGIINTMLMAVLERVKEIGMLMAIGMSKMRIFFMIMIETFFLSIVGAPVGMFIGFLIVRYLGHEGFDFSQWSQGLEDIGYDVIIYPELPLSVYLIVLGGVFITALISALYPARKAIKLKPVEALHKI